MSFNIIVIKKILLIGKGLFFFEFIKLEDVVFVIIELLIELEKELINLELIVKLIWNDLVEFL